MSAATHSPLDSAPRQDQTDELVGLFAADFDSVAPSVPGIFESTILIDSLMPAR